MSLQLGIMIRQNDRKRVVFNVGDPDTYDTVHIEIRVCYRDCFGRLRSTWMVSDRMLIDFKVGAVDNEERVLRHYEVSRQMKLNKRRIYKTV